MPAYRLMRFILSALWEAGGVAVSLLCILSPFIGAGVLAFVYSHSPIAPLLVLAGAVVGAVLMVPSGIAWLQTLHREWMESQAAGFIFVPVLVPFFAYAGASSGASLVAFLYGFSPHPGAGFWFQGLAIGLTVVLGGFIPSAIAALPSLGQFGSAAPDRTGGLAAIAIFAAGTGLAAAWIASQLACLIVASAGSALA